MFDGSFRSKREVNLGSSGNSRRRVHGRRSQQQQQQRGGRRSGIGSSNDSTVVPNDKQSILKNAEILRKQRQEQQRQSRAARLIQRYVRGWETRQHVAKDFHDKMITIATTTTTTTKQQQTMTNSNDDDTTMYKSVVTTATTNHETILSVCLSPPLRSFLKTTQRQLLLDYGRYSSNKITSQDNTTITDTTKRTTTSSFQSTIDYSTSKWFSRKRIVLATLQEFQPNVLDSIEVTTLFSILEGYFSTTRTTDPSCCLDGTETTIPLFLQLVQCTRLWLTKAFSNTTNDDMTIDISDKDITTITQSLCLWSSSFAQSLSNKDPFAVSVLSAVLLGINSLFHPDNNQRFEKNIPSQLRSDDFYTTWIQPLATVCQKQQQQQQQQQQQVSQQQPAEQNTGGTLFNATLQIVQGHEGIILENALEYFCQHKGTNSSPLSFLQLMNYVLSKLPVLAMLSSLVFRGDDLSFLLSTETAVPEQRHDVSHTDMYDSDSDDEETDDSRLDASPKKSRKSASGSSSKRYTRQDLLTLVKLDKLYQEDVGRVSEECFKQVRGSHRMVELARKVGSTHTTWFNWGSLDKCNSSEESTVVLNSYIDILGMLLQSSTSLRTNTKVSSSPFMSHLAFNREFLARLWICVRAEEASSTALSVFCDIFCHYLIALSDVDFLKHHTVVTAADVNERKKIIAEEVIIHLRSILYELFWKKPVLATNVKLHDENSGRGRLLLAGTKLWNSLYERWNRLVRHAPFCEESTWWFPHLASREGDGAVIPSREQSQLLDDNDGSESMDIDDDSDEGEGVAMELSAAEAETDALADSFRDPKMARILTCIPQALPFDRRVKLFHSLLSHDKLKTQDETSEYRRAMLAMMQRGDDGEMSLQGIREKVKIHRRNLYDDSMKQLNALGPKLKRKVQVSFVNQHGAEEAGIDGGGVFKEFLDDLISDAFVAAASSTEKSARTKNKESSRSKAPHLFSVTPMQTLSVNYDVTRDSRMLVHYEFLGRVLGKAVYESILVEPQFCLPFLNQLLGKMNSLEDLKNFDEEYYTNLTKLRHLSEDEINSMEMTFELTIGSTDARETIELAPGGRLRSVTKQNVIEYVYRVSHYLLNVRGAQQTRAFLKGFRDLIPASWVRLFSAYELQKLISGDDSVRGIDVASLKRATQYAGGYHPSQPYIQHFWDILQYDFTPDQQRKLLKFMTSCSRQPLLGFHSLEPAPCIQQIRIPQMEVNKNSRLPTSSTCMNLLKLPNYGNKDLMREKLLAAIEAGAGFELT